MMNPTVRRTAPKDFLWGVAISAHQSEGHNQNSDVWLAENVTPTLFRQPSGLACDSYHRYDQDIAIAASAGFNCYRFGVEWARIEPRPGVFSQTELDRYSRMVDACVAQGLRPMLTYNHFTVPRWFAERGGFEKTDGADLFARYAAKVTERLGDRLVAASTFNEANIQRLLALIRSPTDQIAAKKMIAECAKQTLAKDFSSLLFTDYRKTERVLLDAHRKAMAAIKAGPGSFPVGVTLTMQDIQGVGWINASSLVIDRLYGPWLDEAANADFIGVQTYTRARIGMRGPLPPPKFADTTDAGYEFYPEALGGTIRLAAARTGRPVYVTENGIATSNDQRRIAYINAALREVRKCLDEGIDVRSYIHWSLLDNFEWTAGYSQHFGLVEVDPHTFERKPKPSAFHLGAIAREGRF